MGASGGLRAFAGDPGRSRFPPTEASKAAVCYVRNSSILFQNTLTKVLQEDRIAGAGLDVLEQEPGMSTIPLSSATTSSCRRTPVLDGSMSCGNGAADVKAVLDVQHGRNPRGSSIAR